MRVCGVCVGRVGRRRSDNTTDLNPEAVSVSSVWIQSHDSSFFMAFSPLLCRVMYCQGQAGDLIELYSALTRTHTHSHTHTHPSLCTLIHT